MRNKTTKENQINVHKANTNLPYFNIIRDNDNSDSKIFDKKFTPPSLSSCDYDTSKYYQCSSESKKELHSSAPLAQSQEFFNLRYPSNYLSSKDFEIQDMRKKHSEYQEISWREYVNEDIYGMFSVIKNGNICKNETPSLSKGSTNNENSSIISKPGNLRRKINSILQKTPNKYYYGEFMPLDLLTDVLLYTPFDPRHPIPKPIYSLQRQTSDQTYEPRSKFCDKLVTKGSRELVDIRVDVLKIEEQENFIKKFGYDVTARTDGKCEFRCKAINCKATTKTRYHMKKHVLVHSDIFPYSCPICDSTFLRKENAMEHFKRCVRKYRKRRMFLDY